jgi:hypothetical protein
VSTATGASTSTTTLCGIASSLVSAGGHGMPRV